MWHPKKANTKYVEVYAGEDPLSPLSPSPIIGTKELHASLNYLSTIKSSYRVLSFYSCSHMHISRATQNDSKVRSRKVFASS
ncbi:hypothetical protein GLYMA_05G125300v4 [Glycine max]|uniref:Uncharacterized protein n=2 Tax=Glycine subgen. Soja TaxID=1462606 RepID=K7KPV4_SOYBN|nr:hypothetical protein GYH30_012452 [Glycine max]KRH58392.1 hypothetical protein GLYMA_05G125300v4 [Glycine max]RZC12167.1 hypothetical protein D0Y65_012112 [Glycine soja]